MERPKPIMGSGTDAYNKLLSCCEDYMNEVEGHVEDTDTYHYIFELAMEMVYGGNVWRWINKPTPDNRQDSDIES